MADIAVVWPRATTAALRITAGPAGPPGPAGAAHVHTQSSAATTWTINHNLGARPTLVVCADAGGTEIVGQVVHTTTNQTLVYFSVAVSGTARLV